MFKLKYPFLSIILLMAGCARFPVSNLMTDFSTFASKDIISLETVTGTVNRLGGTIPNELGTTIIQVPESAVETDTQFTLSRRLDSTKQTITLVEANRYSGPFKITLPEPELLQIVPTQQQLAKIQGLKEDSLEAENTYPLRHVWHSQLAHFWKRQGDVGLGNRIEGEILFRTKEKPLFVATIHQAVELISNCAEKGEVQCYQGKEPVLFVHGYVPSVNGLGGGAGTWKDFPELILKLAPNYVVFEFRWITAARLEDVAADLGRAIQQIAQATGQKVHVMAHSFGGILIRTYLQGLASHFPYQQNVASVTTIGTPHSGLTETNKIMHGVSFKRGQDTQGLLSGQLQINFCQQISCYQMGHFIDFNEDTLKIYKLNYPDEFFFRTTFKKYRPIFDVPDHLALTEKPGKFIKVLSDFDHYPLPKDLPMQVLIGLTVKNSGEIQEGDALISLEGQRLSPYLTADISLPLLNKDSRYGGKVTEHILGFDIAVKPGQQNPLDIRDSHYWGYRHSSSPVGTLLRATPAVQIECEYAESCRHAVFKRIKTWLKQHPSQKTLPNKPLLKATLRIIDAKTNQPLPFAYVHIYKKNAIKNEQLWSDIDPLVKIVQTDLKGKSTIQLNFEPKAAYYLDVKAWGYESFRDFKVIRMAKRRKKSPSNWGTVRLTPKPNREQLAGTVTAADSKKALAHVEYVVKNNNVWWAGQTDSQGQFVITGLVPDTTEVYFLKEGYLLKKLLFLPNKKEQRLSVVLRREDL
jgi:pimeloyl-ACP methyl ester carboxylesterase